MPFSFGPVQGWRVESSVATTVVRKRADNDDDAVSRSRYARHAVAGGPDRTLLPPGCFDAEPAGERYTRLLLADAPGKGSGADSPTVQLWLGCRCAGWAEPPTGEEFHAAIRAAEASRRQVAVLDAWANLATWTEALQAWAEHAYTLRELAAALHRAGLARCRLAAILNRWATQAERLEP